MKKVLKILLFPIGMLLFLIRNKTDKITYGTHRYLFHKTGGKYNDFFSKIICIIRRKYHLERSNGFIGNIGKKEVNKITDNIKKNGYHIFEETLSEELVNKIFSFANNQPIRYLDPLTNYAEYSEDKVCFDTDKIVSPRYQFEFDQIVQSQELSSLIFDENLLHIAQEYLDVKPILDLATMWWSAPFSNKKAEDEAAQLYHHDQDRLSFIKFFFYLTDVDTNTGPHCYVEGSHRNIPHQMRRDGRFTDKEIMEVYGNSGIELKGKKGTVLAVDTRGLHKGKVLSSKYRLLFQIQYSNSLFGSEMVPVYNIKSNDNYFLKEKKNKYPRTYSLINII